MDSLDEAEQSRIYKAGHKSFMFSKAITYVLLILLILFKMTINTGVLPIGIVVIIMLSQMMSYYHNTK